MRKRPRFVIAGVLVAAVLCLAAGSFAVYSAVQPLVSCASAPKKPFSKAPASLVTAQDYFMQGDYDYEQGRCDKAIADYTYAIELDPNLAEAYNNRAYIYMVQKDYSSALTDLNLAIELRPNYVNALMNRGDIYNYYYAVNYEHAVADYDKVLTIDPGAAGNTSVCGHRLLALNHGWNLNAFVNVLTKGSMAGCPNPIQ